MNDVAAAIRGASLNLNPLVEKNLIKIPIPKYVLIEYVKPLIKDFEGGQASQQRTIIIS